MESATMKGVLLSVGLFAFCTGCEKDANGYPQMSMRPGMSDHRPGKPRISDHGYANTFYMVAAGQSNMWGQGMMSDPFPALPQIFVYPGSNPNPQPYGGRIGPAYAFALDFAHDHPTTEIVIIPCSVRGSPSTDWVGGGVDFNACVQYWRDAGAPDIGLILYMQGEAEGMSGNAAQAQDWTQNFTNTVGSFRQTFGINSKVLFAQIGPNPGNPNTGPSPDYLTWQEVQNQQSSFNVSNSHMVMTWDLPLSDNWVHFTKDAYFTIGGRMYSAYQY